MKKASWLVLLALGLAACGGNATTTTPSTSVEAVDLDLSGLSLQVHQAPG